MQTLLGIIKYFFMTTAIVAVPFIAYYLATRDFQGVHAYSLESLQQLEWFTKQIPDGDKILWCSGVSPEYELMESMTTAISGVIVGIAGVIFIAFTSKSQAQNPIGPFKLFGWLMVLGGMGFSTAPYWACGKALHTAYVLTDKRAISVYSSGFSETHKYTDHAIERPFVLSGQGNCQVLKFYWTHISGTHTNGVHRRRDGFEGISHGDEALDILEEKVPES